MSALPLIVFNVFTNVSIIIVNKYVFKVHEFNYATFVTFLHFVFTACVARARCGALLAPSPGAVPPSTCPCGAGTPLPL